MISGNLKQLITQIRHALEEIDRERGESGKHALCELDSLELEIKFTVTESNAKKGGFDLKVVTAGAEGSIRDEEIQSIRLRYRTAKQPDSEPLPGTRFHSNARGSRGKSTKLLD